MSGDKKPAMANPEIAQMPFRLPRTEMNRFDKAAEYCGISRQAFVQAAVLSEVADVESKRRNDFMGGPSRPSSALNKDSDEPASTNLATPFGMNLDLFSKTVQSTLPQPAQPAAPTQQQPVIVNVGNNSNDGKSVIDDLASYVADGYDFERSQRKRISVEILRVKASDDEERERLRRQLEDAVALKVKKIDDERSIFRTARIAFDKITDLFKSSEE